MRTLILLFTVGILVLLTTPLLLVCILLRITEPLFWIAKRAFEWSRWILGMKLEIQGLENIRRDKAYIFMPNHLSLLDGPLLFWAIPQPVRVILKKEIFRIPVVGQGMLYVGFVPVDRKGIRGGKQSIDKACLFMREKGYSFLIFPEGTRSRSGKLQEFRRGGFFLAIESRVPIVPVSINGTFELMPKKSFFIKPGKIRVLFHPPVPVQNYSKKNLAVLSQKVRKAISSGLEEDFSFQEG